MTFEDVKKDLIRGKKIRRKGWAIAKYWYWSDGILYCSAPYLGGPLMMHYRVPPAHLEKDRLETDWEVL